MIVEVLPDDSVSAGGVHLPKHGLSADEVQERHRNPEKPHALTAIVHAIGEWPRLPNGMALLPEFGVGAKVLVSPHRGQQMAYDQRKLRMVALGDVLAVLT